MRDENYYNMRAQRLNKKGQLPEKLRHAIKAEDSDENTEDDEKYEAQAAEIDSLMIKGTSIIAAQDKKENEGVD